MLDDEIIYTLDREALDLFALKGRETELPDPFNANGASVRRVMQIVCDLAKKSMPELTVLDLACGEGVYAIETALRGAKVLALDGRTERLYKGKQVAERLGLKNLLFEQNDVRQISYATHGKFDVIYFLGILYHLDVPDVFTALENIYAMCQDFVVIDTHISLNARHKVTWKGVAYAGTPWREHGDADQKNIRHRRLLSSLDNTFSFWLTKESLVKLLGNIGFTSVFECDGPIDPSKGKDRIALIAVKGKRIKISAYPWINDRTEEEIKAILKPKGIRNLLKPLLNLNGSRFLGFTVNGLIRKMKQSGNN